MKNLIIVTAHTGGGGFGRYIFGLVEVMASRGWQITVYCLKHQNNAFSEHDNVNVKALTFVKKLPRIFKYYAFAKRVQWLTKDCNTPILSTVRIFNPSIMVVGGVHLTHAKTRKKSLSFYDKIEIFLEKTAYCHAKYIITHSPLMAEEMKIYNLNLEHKIHMLYPPVSTDIFRYTIAEQKAELKRQLNLPEDKFLIIAAGTCDENKGVPLAVEAIKNLPEFYLMIFGSHYNKPLSDNARHFGEVDNLQDYFAAGDCTLVASRYEAFGLVVVESLQCGTPVIITKEVGSRGLVSDDEGIVLDERTPEAIKSALIKLRDFPLTIKPDFVERKNLDWKYHVNKVEELLKNTAN